MSDIHLITIETALLVSAFAFATWTGNKAHRAAMQVYSGVADGTRLSRRTRRLLLIHIYGGNNIVALVITTLVGLALVQIGLVAARQEASNVAYLFALALFLSAAYLVIATAMTILSLGGMIDRGQRGKPP